MPTFIALIAAYGVTFGLQQKAFFLHGKNAFLDRLLHCTYCTGFWAGVLVWLMYWVADGFPKLGVVSVASILVWAFTSSAFSYAIDAAVRWLEVRTPAE